MYLKALHEIHVNGEKFHSRNDLFHKMSTIIDSHSPKLIQSFCYRAKTRIDNGKAHHKDQPMWDLINDAVVTKTNYATKKQKEDIIIFLL